MLMRSVTLTLLFFFSVSLGYSQAGDATEQRQRPPFGQDFPSKVRGELFFKVSPSSDVDVPAFEEGDDPEALFGEIPGILEIIDDYGVQRIHCPFRTQDPGIQHTYKVEFEKNSDARTQALVEHLSGLEYVNYAEPVQRFRSFYNPNDVASEQQWYLDSIKAFQAWDLNKGDPNTTIAIVDDAVQIDHPDLSDNIKENSDEQLDGTDTDGNGYVDDVNGWDAADQNNDPTPPDSHSYYSFTDQVFTHGTHTAGIASGVTDNGKGIAGMGFNNAIIPVKTVSDNSNLPFGIEAGAEGIDYAIQAEADIISMSFGGQKDCTVINMLEVAHADSIVLIAAAGNNGNSDTLWPGGMEEVIAIGSTKRGDTVSDFSQYGTWLDLMAPGDSIYSTLWVGSSQSHTYGKQAGTSMACPLTAGVAGLMLSHRWWAHPYEVRQCLKQGAKNIDSINPSYIDSMGAGRLNAYASLQCIETKVGLKEREEQTGTELDLYPNPSSGMVRWERSGPDALQSVQVMDLTGREVRSYGIDIDQRTGKMDLSGLAKNIYLLRFRTVDGQSITKKLSIVR